MHTFTGIKTRMGGESFIQIQGTSKETDLILDMTQCSAILLKNSRHILLTL